MTDELLAERRELALLLAPYRDLAMTFGDDLGADDQQGWRFVDAPPAVASAALVLVESALPGARPNGQPPSGWLVEQAGMLDGRVCGSVAPARSFLRIDSVALPAPAGPAFTAAVRAAWPAGVGEIEPLRPAVVEAWESWDATRALWTGAGIDDLPPLAPGAVLTYWWD